MIVPMSKFSFLVYHHDYDAFLESVRRHGVVHLIGRDEEVSDQERERYALLKRIQHVVRELLKRNIDATGGAVGDDANGSERFAEVTALLEERENLQRMIAQNAKEVNQVKPWGDFAAETLKALRERGINVRFYTAPARKFNTEWPAQYPIEVLGNMAGLVYFVLADTGDGSVEIDADEMRPPERPLGELLKQKEELEQSLQKTEKQLDEHAAHSIEALKKYGYDVLGDLEWEKAMGSAASTSGEKVKLLQGWVPEERKEELVQYLEENKILYVVDKPVKDEKVPVLLKNNKFSKDFEPLGELYSMPDYKELDMTPFFAPFYLVFFGFCLGDAGYGILMAIAALLMKKRVRQTLRGTMNLIFYLGISTIAFGILGGTFFGIPLYETNLPVYSTLAERFAAQGTDINNLLFYLALMLGGVQIMFGMVLKAMNEMRQMGWRYALSTIGWIILLTGIVVIALVNQLANVPMESLNPYLYVLVAISGAMILLLNTPGKNVVMNVGVGIWNTYNMVTGILGDLLSYIRLFALGIASAIMGFVFNSLAVEMSGSIPVVSAIVMVIILVIGHSINLFMAGLGAFVHPLRLTFVEFYKNAGFTGGGKKYHPFKKIS